MVALVGTGALADRSADRPYPWVPADAGHPVLWSWQFELPAPPERVWPCLAESSIFNRAFDHPEMAYQEVDGQLHGRCRYNWLPHRFVEPPWSWVYPHHIECVRFFSAGFARCMQLQAHIAPLGETPLARSRPPGAAQRGRPSARPGFAEFPRGLLEPGATGSRVRLELAWYPKGRFFAAGYKLSERRWRRRYQHAFDALAADLRASKPLVLRRAPKLSSAARASLERHRADLAAAVEPAVADALIGHIADADDVDLVRLRPIALAHVLGVGEQALLRACLHATRGGLLNLTWDLMCPHCRGVRSQLTSLGEVPARASCAPCGVEFDPAAPRAIEVTFHVHPSVRAVPDRTYCLGEAGSKPHIRLQQRLAPGRSVTLGANLDPGPHRIRRLGAQGSEADLAVGDEGPARVRWSAKHGPNATSAAPGAAFTLVNDSDEAQVFVVEALRWSSDALHPGRLFNLQTFRDLFAREHLAVGLQLEVGEQTIVFTDVVGSSRLYEGYGDGVAFAAVKRHFEIVYEVVRARGGAVVKTIGDAAMVAFDDPATALAAAREIHARFGAGEAVRLRISVHAGPCIAVNLNSGIDYFGTTVNRASKMQDCAGPGGVALSADLLERPGVADALAGVDLERLTYRSEKLLTPLEVARFDASISG